LPYSLEYFSKEDEIVLYKNFGDGKLCFHLEYESITEQFMQKQPKIGASWIYHSQIYLKSIEPNELKLIEGFINSAFAHYQM